MAQSADLSKTQAVANTWWYHGYVEAGGRFFLNNPDTYGAALATRARPWANTTSTATCGRAPSAISASGPGPPTASTCTASPRKNIGYDDQVYTFDASKAGEHYFNFQWDETPHKYSTNARTIYNGVGGNHLTLPGGLSNQLFVQSGNVATITAANRDAIQSMFEANSHQTDIGIQPRHRQRGLSLDADDELGHPRRLLLHAPHRHAGRRRRVLARHQRRRSAQVPKPVDDTTQNFGLNGEYVGTSPWGQTFNFKVGYNGSIYEDRWDSYLVDNPFCPTGAGVGGCARTGPCLARWPGCRCGRATRPTVAPRRSAPTCR